VRCWMLTDKFSFCRRTVRGRLPICGPDHWRKLLRTALVFLAGVFSSYVGGILLLPLASSYDPPKLEPPQLSRPFDNTIFNEYPGKTTRTWLPVKGADHYLVEVQYCRMPCNPPADQWYDAPHYPVMVRGEESYTYPFIAANHGRWRVIAVGLDQIRGQPSKWWHFRHELRRG
jgi:hypothetical protein